MSSGHYLAANGAPGTGSLDVPAAEFFWNILVDTSGDFRLVQWGFLVQSPSFLVWLTPVVSRLSVPATANVVTQVSPSGVDIRPNSSAANSAEQRWHFSVRN